MRGDNFASQAGSAFGGKVAFVKANFDLIDEDFDEATPVVHIISDSLGDTASEVVNAAAG